MRKSSPVLNTLLAASILALGTGVAGRAADAPASLKDSTPPAAASSGKPAFLPTEERLRGLVKPLKQVTMTAPLEGIVKELLVKEGDRVKLGQPVARMDDELQTVSVAIAKLKAADETDLRKQTLLLEESKIQLERMTELEKTDAARSWEVRKSKLQRDASEAAVDAAKYQIEVAKANLVLETKKLDRYRMLAPFDGRVVRIPTEVGASVNAQDQVITIVQIDVLEAELFLPTQIYTEFRKNVGKEYRLMAESPVNKELVGKLIVAEPVFDAASQTFRCVIHIDNKGEELPAGFTARLIWPQ
jgi:RND family efflux transporter MFP subunit